MKINVSLTFDDDKNDDDWLNLIIYNRNGGIGMHISLKNLFNWNIRLRANYFQKANKTNQTKFMIE